MGEKEIISRSEAKACDLVRYYTGKPCKRGHVAKRRVDNGGCVECVREKDRANYKENPEHHKEKVRKYYRENADLCNQRRKQWAARNAESEKQKKKERYKENAEQNREYQRRYYSENSDYYKERNKVWYAENLDRRKEYQRKWRQDNPEALRAQLNRRRALKRQADGHHSADDIRALHKQQKGKCAYCRTQLGKNDYHVDHITPLAKNGSNWPKNLQLLCPDCNLSKNSKCPVDYAQERGLLI